MIQFLDTKNENDVYPSTVRQPADNTGGKEVQRVMQEAACPQTVLHPAFLTNNIPVVFAANNQYVPVFAAALYSLLEHVSPEYHYDIVLLESDVRKDNMDLLSGIVQGHPNVSLRFFNVLHLTKDYNLQASGYISVETYYRFLIQDVLPDYDKVLYLDCDVILKADVAELFRTDVAGYLLAAVRDPDFLGQIHGASKETQKYIKKTFHMKDPNNYFQAGVLLFNEKEMRKIHTLDQWLTFCTTPYMYNDQDVLNLYCEGRVKYLDMAWNLLTDCDHTRISNVIVHAPEEIRQAYRQAYDNPKIIHYAGHMKPWHKPTEDQAQHFWSTLKNTPYYEEAFYQMMENVAQERIREAQMAHSPIRKLWRFLKRAVLSATGKDTNR